MHRPYIIPGQAIQEFWNNQLAAVDTLATGIKRKFDGFKDEFARIDPAFEGLVEDIRVRLEQFQQEHGNVYDEATLHTTVGFLESLKAKALVPYAPRCALLDLAIHRKRTKTPPGFRDDGDGDFFVWTDFLIGLLTARRQRSRMRRAVLITNDKKPDWVRSGSAHPILVAEVAALVGIPFEIWNLDRLISQLDA